MASGHRTSGIPTTPGRHSTGATVTRGRCGERHASNHDHCAGGDLNGQRWRSFRSGTSKLELRTGPLEILKQRDGRQKHQRGDQARGHHGIHIGQKEPQLCLQRQVVMLLSWILARSRSETLAERVLVRVRPVAMFCPRDDRLMPMIANVALRDTKHLRMRHRQNGEE